jgi:peptidoglycan/xylan/chitin deacetylase (PgdA/CDA1 family)
MIWRKLVAAGGLLLACHVAAPARAEVDRPPQFVVMAFDNCTELETWQELADFAAEANSHGKRIHFTFFVSGINFIADAIRMIYQGPQQPRGLSRINFGGSPEQVRRRVDYVNALHSSGHEIASHAVGHFNGSGWSAGDWQTEFRSFHDVLSNVGPNNGLTDTKLAFPLTQVVGFRSPYLAKNAGLYAALKQSRFRYDASGVGRSDAWPERIDGIWRFNLAMLRIAASGKNTLSMDYNFFVAHSRAVTDPRRFAMAREQMLATYLHYFTSNYAGNRAPLHIGHHFSAMQGGAYNDALKSFARAVCGLPEVRCVTYTELADFMDRQSAENLAAYRKGEFARAAAPPLTPAEFARGAHSASME